MPPPMRRSMPPEDVSDDVSEYVEDVEEVIEEPAAIAAPISTENEMVVEVSTEEVEVDADVDSSPRIASRGSGPVPGVATSETHMRTSPPAAAETGGVLEVADDSVPDVAVADSGEVEYETPRHTPPPASGSQRAGEPEEVHDPSGQWNQVGSASAEETGVRSSSRISTRPENPPASARQPSVAPPASGKHPSMPAPAADAPVSKPAEAPTATFVQLEGVVVSSQGSLPKYEASLFTALLDDSLDL